MTYRVQSVALLISGGFDPPEQWGGYPFYWVARVVRWGLIPWLLIREVYRITQLHSLYPGVTPPQNSVASYSVEIVYPVESEP